MCQENIEEAVVILGGFLGNQEKCWLKKHLPIMAVDHGADHALTLGLKPDILLGDLDSISEEARELCLSGGTEIIKYPAQKDFTDSELAFAEAKQRGWTRLLVLAAWGGRQDHQLSNILLAARYLEHFQEIVLPGRDFCAYLRRDGYRVAAANGRLISLIPLTEIVEAVYTENMLYPLCHEDLFFGCGRGLSNVIQGEQAMVSYASGKLLLIQSHQ